MWTERLSDKAEINSKSKRQVKRSTLVWSFPTGILTSCSFTDPKSSSNPPLHKYRHHENLKIEFPWDNYHLNMKQKHGCKSILCEVMKDIDYTLK